MKIQPELHGAILPSRPPSKGVKWPLRFPRHEQGTNQCNPAALANVLSCHPQGKWVSMQYAAEQWYEPVKTPHGSLLKDVLAMAKKNGDIRDFNYIDDADELGLSVIQKALKTEPLLVGMPFFPSMYDNTDTGRVHITEWINDKDVQTGHTWCAFGKNPESRLISFYSSWQKDEPYRFRFEDISLLMQSNRAEIATITP